MYADLLAHFGGQLAQTGNSRRPSRGSLGSRLQAHVGGESLAAYVGPILMHERCPSASAGSCSSRPVDEWKTPKHTVPNSWLALK